MAKTQIEVAINVIQAKLKACKPRARYQYSAFFDQHGKEIHLATLHTCKGCVEQVYQAYGDTRTQAVTGVAQAVSENKPTYTVPIEDIGKRGSDDSQAS